MKYFKYFAPIIILIYTTDQLHSSGGYDHGTATGKGKLELDFTWNPFDYFEDGQSYIVLGYGLTNRLDIHGYLSHHPDGTNNYYYGIFYQFINLKHLDLATAGGIRAYTNTTTKHMFLPQLLYNIKLTKGYTVGGSLVNIRTLVNDNPGNLGITLDIALFIPLTKYLFKNNKVEEMKLGLGAFRPVLWKPKSGDFYPTYSLDIKFNFDKFI